MPRNLIIVRSGRDSLHRFWSLGYPERDWDVKCCPYEDLGENEPDTIPGQKWTGLSELLRRWDGWHGYRYVWLPDDDIFSIPRQISWFFRRCRELNVKIAAPALSEDSFYTWPITMRNRSYVARETTYVENMAPCFRVDILHEVLQTFAMTRSGFGWGLSYVWAKRVGYKDVFIIDDAAMFHTRAVGQTRDKGNFNIAKAEMHQLLLDEGTVAIQKTLQGHDENGRTFDCSSDQFMSRYLAGYHYLITKRPDILGHLRAQQASSIPI